MVQQRFPPFPKQVKKNLGNEDKISFSSFLSLERFSRGCYWINEILLIHISCPISEMEGEYLRFLQQFHMATGDSIEPSQAWTSPRKSDLSGGHLFSGDTLASHLTLWYKLLRFHIAPGVVKSTFQYEQVTGPHSVCSQMLKFRVALSCTFKWELSTLFKVKCALKYCSK